MGTTGGSTAPDSAVYTVSSPYQLLKVLGRGRSGTVHLALDVRKSRRVALKIAAPADVKREFAALTELAHRSVVQVLGRLLLYFFEHRFDLHVANRIIPLLIPLALAALIAGASSPVGGLLFVLLYGLGNGMLTIVKGTAIAQYVNREHVASLNGALGLPQAVARAIAPLLLGVLWSREAGYRWGLLVLLGVAIVSALALVLAQRRSLLPR